MSGNKSFNTAKRNKRDEFYTQLVDIEREVLHYRDHFRDKVIFCNCDDPEHSDFWWFFKLNFDFLGLNKLITTHYDMEKPTYKLVIDGTKRDKDGNPTEKIKSLKGNGDFRSPEAIEMLKESDIVVSNPPFSLFREYIAQLMEYDKQFLVIGNQNAVTYRDIFRLFQDNKLWYGVSIKSGDREFQVPDDYLLTASGTRVDSKGNKFVRVKGVRWFTNLKHSDRYENLILVKRYKGNEELYPDFDNYDAINVDVTKDIPEDYEGVMGVPITFLDKYNPEQFDIVGITKTWYGIANKIYPKQLQHNTNGTVKTVSKLNDGPVLAIDAPIDKTYYEVDGQLYEQKYARVLIRHKRSVN